MAIRRIVGIGFTTALATALLLAPPAAAAGPAAPTSATPAAQSVHPHSPTRPSTIALPDGLRPEGITSHGLSYFVGSLADGRIVTGNLLWPGKQRVLLPGSPGRQLRGLAVDPRTGWIWAAGNVGAVAHVYAVDARSGAIRSDTVVPGGGFLNDVVVTRTAVWITDSRVERLTAIGLSRSGRPTGAAPRFLALGGAWPGAQGGTGANGIRSLDGKHVLLDHSTAGGLWAVDLRTGSATEVPVTGGPAITGGDGIERFGSTIWVVRGTTNVSVAQLKLIHHRSGWSARWQRLLTDPTLDVPSTATFALGSLYAVNARFGVPAPETATYSVTRLR